MAESQGTWVKLGEQSWQFIPREIKQVAHKLDLTWEDSSNDGETAELYNGAQRRSSQGTGMYHVHNRVSLKPRDATRDSIEIVEISPRSASTAKVTSQLSG